MQLLFLTSRFPYPPHRGDRLRAYNFIRSLAQEHQIDLISFIASSSETNKIPLLLEYCRSVKTVKMGKARSAFTTGLNLWRRQPLQALYYRSSAMKRLVDKAINNIDYDAVYVHLFRMAPYLQYHQHLYRVVDLTDLISQEIERSLLYRSRLSRCLYSIEKLRIERYESLLARTFEETWLISEADRKTLARKCPHANIRLLRNGVDTRRYHPIIQTRIPDQIIFVGHMSVFHNIDAAEYLAWQIFPLIQREAPNAQLMLTGANPSLRVKTLDKLPGVSVTGFVENLNLALNQAAVFVAPLRFAAGVQNKVLEAMAAGLPVVTTPIVNQGLAAQPGRDLLVADDPQEIARQTISLMNDERKRMQMGKDARRFIQENYRWDFVQDRINSIEKLLLQEVDEGTP